VELDGYRSERRDSHECNWTGIGRRRDSHEGNWTGIGRRDETVTRVTGLISVGETRQLRG